MNTVARPTGPVRAPSSHGQFALTQLTRMPNAAGTVLVKNDTNGPANQLYTAMATVLMPWNAACTIARNVSDFLYATTRATPSATIAVMTRMIGLAFMTALKAACAIVAPFCTVVHARIAPR